MIEPSNCVFLDFVVMANMPKAVEAVSISNPWKPDKSNVSMTRKAMTILESFLLPMLERSFMEGHEIWRRIKRDREAAIKTIMGISMISMGMNGLRKGSAVPALALPMEMAVAIANTDDEEAREVENERKFMGMNEDRNAIWLGPSDGRKFESKPSNEPLFTPLMSSFNGICFVCLIRESFAMTRYGMANNPVSNGMNTDWEGMGIKKEKEPSNADRKNTTNPSFPSWRMFIAETMISRGSM